MNGWISKVYSILKKSDGENDNSENNDTISDVEKAKEIKELRQKVSDILKSNSKTDQSLYSQ